MGSWEPPTASFFNSARISSRSPAVPSKKPHRKVAGHNLHRGRIGDLGSDALAYFLPRHPKFGGGPARCGRKQRRRHTGTASMTPWGRLAGARDAAVPDGHSAVQERQHDGVGGSMTRGVGKEPLTGPRLGLSHPLGILLCLSPSPEVRQSPVAPVDFQHSCWKDSWMHTCRRLPVYLTGPCGTELFRSRDPAAVLHTHGRQRTTYAHTPMHT